MPAGRPPKYETVEDFERRVDLYFLKVRFNRLVSQIKRPDDGNLAIFLTEHQEALDQLARDLELDEDEIALMHQIDEERPLVCGLAAALDLTRQGLIEYADKDEFSDAVKRAKLRIEASVENSLYHGAAAGPIFNLKNNFNWRDERTQNLTLKSHEQYLRELEDEDESQTDGGQNDE